MPFPDEVQRLQAFEEWVTRHLPHPAAPGGNSAGAAPPYASYASFSDPDGNGWLLQETTERAPGRA